MAWSMPGGERESARVSLFAYLRQWEPPARELGALQKDIAATEAEVARSAANPSEYLDLLETAANGLRAKYGLGPPVSSESAGLLLSRLASLMLHVSGHASTPCAEDGCGGAFATVMAHDRCRLEGWRAECHVCKEMAAVAAWHAAQCEKEDCAPWCTRKRT